MDVVQIQSIPGHTHPICGVLIRGLAVLDPHLGLRLLLGQIGS